MRDALNRTGRKIVLSIEPFSINPDPESSKKVSNLWRVACDIRSDWDNIVNRADISDKWSPLAGPGGWNDPDMINVKNPPSLSLGENRVYFGLWALMKAPLLLSSDLPSLVPEVLTIINNTEVIQINQDSLGVQARKLAIDGKPLPWLVGLSACDSSPKTSYSRSFGAADSDDNREWEVLPIANNSTRYMVKNKRTGRCLALAPAGTPDRLSQPQESTMATPNPSSPNLTVALLPCKLESAEQHGQAWIFGKGLHSPSSMYSATNGAALAVSNETLHGQIYGQDAFPVPSAAYGDTVLKLVPRYDQQTCTSRNCQNYDDTQMWYFDPVENLLRAATFVASINHKNDGHGYTLTDKVPTYQHHWCVIFALRFHKNLLNLYHVA